MGFMEQYGPAIIGVLMFLVLGLVGLVYRMISKTIEDGKRDVRELQGHVTKLFSAVNSIKRSGRKEKKSAPKKV